jgi:two-component system response regulator HydG
MRGQVLIVDDDREMCRLLESALGKKGYTVAARQSAAEAFDLVVAEDFDAVITDLNMKGMNGLALCERIVANRPDVPTIVITAFGNMETAIAAIRAGAYDFITKPFEIDALELTLQRAVQHRSLREEVKRLRKVVTEGGRAGELLGRSPAMTRVYDMIARLGDSEASVLITGESGTGKEVVARALHEKSRRRGGPFVAINCAAMPEALLESELFGHARGAFTDATSAKVGLFVQAHGETLFLDEIGDMPLGLQPKLLRALEERKVRPVGATQEVPFDARVVAATNRDLESAVEERRFREDLYYRINVVHIQLPPLRARGNDVLLLAQHFLESFATISGKKVVGVSAAAADKLLAYHWPGNVREVKNCVERAVALTQFAELSVEDLPEKVRDYRSSHVIVASDDASDLVPMEEVEHVLKSHSFACRPLATKQVDATLDFRQTCRRRHEPAPSLLLRERCRAVHELKMLYSPSPSAQTSTVITRV